MIVALLITAGLQSLLFSAEPGGLRASLLTCAPGPDVFNLYGHSAIRIQGVLADEQGYLRTIDSTWNFGVYDFQGSDFIYRFVKGDTDYLVVGEETDRFLWQYQYRNREVTEQDLNLSDSEVGNLLASLRYQALPENRVYRYNYLRDNCATRVEKSILNALTDTAVFSETKTFSTARSQLRRYNYGYPWYQMGLDMILGSQLDEPGWTAADERFIPIEMREQFSWARKGDGTLLVAPGRILVAAHGPSVLPPTPWYKGPVFWMTIVLAIVAYLCLYQIRRMKILKWFNSFWCSIVGMAGILVAFMVFFSSHEASSPNVLIVWLNPLPLVAAFTIWFRRMRMVSMTLSALMAIGDAGLLIAWPFVLQTTSMPVILLLVASFLQSACYAIIVYQNLFKRKWPERE